MMKKLKIMTCAEIREHLERTNMSEEEKIEFVEQNLNSSRFLRSYIDSQHYGVKEMNFMTKTVSEITTRIGNETYGKFTELFQASNLDSDEDCEYLQRMLKDYYAGKNKDSRWTRVTAAANGILEMAKKGLGAAYSVAAQAAPYAQIALSWAFTTGFRLWTWVASNPQTAYFSLLCMRNFKNRICSKAGAYFAELGVKLDGRDTLIRFIEKTTGVPPRPDTPLESLTKTVYELGLPGMTTFIYKSAGEIASTILQLGGKKLGTLLGGALSVVPAIGPVLGVSIGFIMEAVCEEVGNQMKYTAEQALYFTHVENAFSSLIELVNPFSCLVKMNEGLMKTLKIDVEKDFQTRLNDAEAKKGRPLEYDEKIGAIRFQTDRQKKMLHDYNNCTREQRKQRGFFSRKTKREIEEQCERGLSGADVMEIREFKKQKGNAAESERFNNAL